MTKEHAEVIIPLLAAQPYITEVEHNDNPDGVTHCFHDFRTKSPHLWIRGGELHYNLATWQAGWFGILPSDLDLSPWLTVERKEEDSKGRAVVSRSLRYQNPSFPWAQYISEHGNPIFVGLREEHHSFPHRETEWRVTENLLQVAELIAGSLIFIGNQSAPLWIALGLGHPLICEMDRDVVNRNSVIERDNAKYVS